MNDKRYFSMPCTLPTIRAERCILRPWRPDDAKAAQAIANSSDIAWNPTYKFPHPMDEEAVIRFMKFHIGGNGGDSWQFAIQSDDRLIGGCGAIRGQNVETHTANIGYWLGVDYWGRGLATEAVAALVDFMIEQTEIEQLTATCFGWNPASARVLEKLGFCQEGVRKGVVKKWGRQTDLIIFGKPIL